MLNGQELLRVSAHGGETLFAFDLDGGLETTPYENDRSSSTWLLYTPSGLVLTYRSDGCYSWHSGAQAGDSEIWREVPAGV